MDQTIIDLYDDYTHKPLARRVFLERLVRLTGSLAAAELTLTALECNYAQAAVVAEDDPRILSGTFEINSGAYRGYTAWPRAMNPDTTRAAVIVIHENRGLNPHIRDVARHVATEGFFAIAPDLLSSLGGTPGGRGPGPRIVFQTETG